MQPNFINNSVIKLLAQESEEDLIEKEPAKTYDWITIIYNTFFSTGYETIKQKET
jgi:hypothetical protein